jgi:anhydro-N-acetylmuramic acid kinase
VHRLLTSARIDAQTVLAIGSHGQTVRHAPDAELPWTLQIGDPTTLAVNTGIHVVADFRRQDIAAGGHGAPLAPGFHAAVFQSNNEDRVILNLGGIANISILPRHGAITGFDTGPANSLLDLWVQQHRQTAFDDHGEWARSGIADHALLHHWIDNTPWLNAPPPKSTGRETFGLAWLKQYAPATHKPEDIQATLIELTACTIADAITHHAPLNSAIYACGGGTRNAFLMERLTARLAPHAVHTTRALGMDPQWVEATAFAWLARQRILELPGNLPAVTGAKRPLVLGAIYHAR